MNKIHRLTDTIRRCADCELDYGTIKTLKMIDDEATKQDSTPQPEQAEASLEHDLSCWFGLSYASWLTVPRVMMEAMPEEWKQKMAKLLNEYDEMFPNQPDIGTRVQVTKDGKLTKTPAWLLNYRRPDFEMLDKMKTYPKSGSGYE